MINTDISCKSACMQLTRSTNLRLYRVQTGAQPLTDRLQNNVTQYTLQAREEQAKKWSPSVLSDAEVPRPVSPLSAVPGRRPKRLWNFSDTAGVCHSMSANRANVYLRNRTKATDEYINTCWIDTWYAFWLQRVNTLTRWFGFNISMWGCHSTRDNVTWLRWGENYIIIQYRHIDAIF